MRGVPAAAILVLLALASEPTGASTSSRRRRSITCGFNSTSNCTALSSTTSCRALCELFLATRGTAWVRNDGWGDPNRPVCGTFSRPYLDPWHGIKCGAVAPRFLDLSANNLTGTLPASLGSLTELLSILVKSNSLSGSIPEGVTKLALGTFNGVKNALSGSIPQIWNVASLLLGFNRLSGTLGVQHTYRGTLNLLHNRISGTLPGSWGPFLELLDLGANRISGSIPSLSVAIELNVSTNNLSGTLPSLPQNIVQFEADGNRISGTVGPGVWNHSGLEMLALSKNSLSGTLPSWRASLAHFWARDNRLSGVLPPVHSAALQSLKMGNNALSGTIPLAIVSPRLRILLLQANSISGTLPPFALPEPGLGLSAGLQAFVFSNNALSGTIPPTTGHLQILAGGSNQLSGSLPDITTSIVVSLNHNRISGTLPSHLILRLGDQFKLDPTLDLTNSRISGTVPATLLASPRLRGLLLNDMRLSGTLPAVNSSIQSLGLARNYLQGHIGQLHGRKLQTLLVSSNYLSCEASDLHYAVHLGQGLFNNPVPEALNQFFQTDASSSTRKGERQFPVANYSNVVLAFAGNPQLTDSAGHVPPRAAGRLLRQDEIRQGRRHLFQGDSSSKLVVLVVLPTLWVGHALVVSASLLIFSGEPAKGFGMRLKDYLWPRKTHAPSVVLRLFQDSARSVCAMCAVGLCLQVLIVLTPNVTGETDCVEGIARTTIGQLRFGAWQQWVWVILVCSLMGPAHYVCEQWRRGDRRASAKRGILGWATRVLDGFEPRQRCIDQWRAGTRGGSRVWSRALFHALLVLTLCVASVPACGFVLSQNVPADSAWYLTIFGNSLAVAVTKLGFRRLLVPKAAEVLALVRHGWRPKNLDRVSRVCETHAQIVLLFNVVTVLVAPMLAVFVLDESCLRYYSLFTPALSTLLDAWGIGKTGLASYRLQFCSRTLISQFAPVWIILLLMDAMLGPSMVLLRSWPCVERLKTKLRVLFRRLDKENDAFSDARHVHAELATFLSSLLTTLVFGVAVAPLLVLAPLVVWLRQCSQHWRSDREESVSLASKAVGDLFVQVPVGLFQSLLHIGSWVFCGCILVDLQFDIGPAILFSLASVAEVALVIWQRQSFSSSAPKKAHPLVLVDVRPCLELNPICTTATAVQDAKDGDESPRLLWVKEADIGTASSEEPKRDLHATIVI